MQSDEACVRSPWWNRWPPSVPAASRWCWSCRSGLAHSRWCSGPRWTPRWAVDTDSGLGPPGPAGGPLWWCGPDTAPLIVKWNVLLGLKTSHDLSVRVSLSLLIYMLFTVIYWNACSVWDHNFSSDWSLIHRNTFRTVKCPELFLNESDTEERKGKAQKPLAPLMTRPSSAQTDTHTTSWSWPVRTARGAG